MRLILAPVIALLFVGLLLTGVTVNAQFAFNWPEYVLANVGVVLLVLRSSRWVLNKLVGRAH
jgi:cytochrome bd-type quinol oxidase subunit 1